MYSSYLPNKQYTYFDFDLIKHSFFYYVNKQTKKGLFNLDILWMIKITSHRAFQIIHNDQKFNSAFTHTHTLPHGRSPNLIAQRDKPVPIDRQAKTSGSWSFPSNESPILMEIDNAICGSHLVKSPLRKISTISARARALRGPFLN